METKVCSKCKEGKNLCEFGKLSSSKDGLSCYCKECNRKKSKEYRGKNPEKCLESQKKWRDKNPEWVYNRLKRWVDDNRDKSNEMKRNWLDKNPHKRKEYRLNYNDRKNEIKRYRTKNDVIYNLTTRMRTRLYKYLKSTTITKKNTTFEIIGCTPEFLKEHLEQQFVDGMTWENRSEWHIDHIIPLSSANNEEEIYKLCHYTNLQPLWAEDNLKKGNKIVESNN